MIRKLDGHTDRQMDTVFPLSLEGEKLQALDFKVWKATVPAPRPYFLMVTMAVTYLKSNFVLIEVRFT